MSIFIGFLIYIFQSPFLNVIFLPQQQPPCTRILFSILMRGFMLYQNVSFLRLIGVHVLPKCHILTATTTPLFWTSILYINEGVHVAPKCIFLAINRGSCCRVFSIGYFHKKDVPNHLDRGIFPI